jgi:ABC-2 type transport system permease protein
MFRGRLIFELAKKSFQRQMAYRAANIAGLFTNLFFGMLRASVMVAVFAYRDNVGGYTLSRAITFTGLTQALLAPIQLWGWRYVMETIKSGAIVSDLARPIDFYLYWLAQDMGRALYHLLFRGLPILLLYWFFFPIDFPLGLAHWGLFGLSLALALLLAFSLNFLVNLAAFWVVDAIGIIRITGLVHTFLSGFLVPAAFFPPWLRLLARLTPFISIVNTPVEVYLGVVSGRPAFQAVLEQFLWLLLLIALGRGLLRQGVKKLTVQGG